MVHIEGVVTHIQRPQEGPGLLHALQGILHHHLQRAPWQLGQARVETAQVLDAGRALKEALQVVIHGHLGRGIAFKGPKRDVPSINGPFSMAILNYQRVHDINIWCQSRWENASTIRVALKIVTLHRLLNIETRIGAIGNNMRQGSGDHKHACPLMLCS